MNIETVYNCDDEVSGIIIKNDNFSCTLDLCKFVFKKIDKLLDYKVGFHPEEHCGEWSLYYDGSNITIIFSLGGKDLSGNMEYKLNKNDSSKLIGKLKNIKKLID